MTLAILSGVLVVLMTARQTTRQTPRSEAAFWRTFQANWRHVQSDVQAHHHNTIIRFKPEKGVVFDGAQWHQVLELPKTLRILKEQEIAPKKSGNFSPQRVSLYSTATQQKYEVVIQMGWGVYQVEAK